MSAPGNAPPALTPPVIAPAAPVRPCDGVQAAISRPRAPLSHRIAAGGIAALCLALLITASRLSPSSDGLGTHRQLGLPPCGWMMYFHKPCMTCGMTTAFAHTARFEFLSAAKAQPFGFALALLTPIALWLSLHVAVTGSRLFAWVAGLLSGRAVWFALAALLASWGYKLLTTQG